MAEFLTTIGIKNYIEKIISEAKNEIVLVSPFLGMSTTMFEKLKQASSQNIKIKLIYGKAELWPNDKKYLRQVDNIEVYFFEHLHSKCYLNESNMVITSMNWIESSQRNNHEMGISIERDLDKELFENAVTEVDSILRNSKRRSLIKKKRNIYGQKDKPQPNFEKSLFKDLLNGHCIKCRSKIPFDLANPYCEDCLSKWNKSVTKYLNEIACHTCGNDAVTNVNRPECSDCYYC